MSRTDNSLPIDRSIPKEKSYVEYSVAQIINFVKSYLRRLHYTRFTEDELLLEYLGRRVDMKELSPCPLCAIPFISSVAA